MSSNETQGQATESGPEAQAITPEVARKVADRVFQLLKEEARIEYERYRPVNNHRRFGQGGR